MPTPERVLAIDVSTRNLGWAATVEVGRPPAADVWLLDGPRVLHQLYAQVRNSIEDLIAEHRPDELIYVPALVGGKGHTMTKQLNGVEAVAILAAYDKGVRPRPVSESAARGLLLGRKVMPSDEAKAAALAWCDERGWPHRNDDNVADACIIWAARQRVLRLPLAGD